MALAMGLVAEAAGQQVVGCLKAIDTPALAAAALPMAQRGSLDCIPGIQSTLAGNGYTLELALRTLRGQSFGGLIIGYRWTLVVGPKGRSWIAVEQHDNRRCIRFQETVRPG